ncbi:MAG TPA: carboxypeptidase regulatory-like domain-containing protein [Candidatus Angelobacter sp.]|nr:carboxypeptidase regulatory-like domain-containing protein [Candidatus Angelobacter sp.]
MNRKLRALMSLAAVTLALVWCIPSVGQVIRGSISGTVVDPSGAVVSGAQVKAKNVETATVFTSTSDGSGLFRLNLLPIGTYTVEITAQGFKTASQSGVIVGAGSDRGLGSVHLTVGEATATVEVNAEAPLIEATQAQITNTFSGTALGTFSGTQENQGLDQMALFIPGVSSTRNDGFSNTNGAGFTVNGLRGRNNDQQIDGQNNNDNSVGGPGLFLSNPEFVSQYVLVTNNFGPEYGRNAGSVVNIITKSGGNAWHGSIFGNENSNFLNALSNSQRRFGKKPDGVTPISGPPRFNDENTGFQLNGPWIKNRLFFFGAFQDELISANNVFTGGSLVPTPAGLNQLNGCYPGSQNLTTYGTFGPFGITAGNPIATDIVPTLVGTNPACGGGPPGPGRIPVPFTHVQRTLPGPFHEFDFITKLDFTLGSDTISGRYIFNRNNNFNATGTGSTGYIGNVPDLNQQTYLAWTHNFTAHMVNEARVSFGRLNAEFGGNNFGNTIVPAGQLDQAFTNISFNNTFSGFGPATNLPQARIVNTWQAQDNWNYVLGKHQLKAGINWTYQRSPNIFLPNLNGQYRFSNFFSFIQNTPNRVTIANGPSSLDFREYDTFLYVGDDWKISQALTLNLGLTWSNFGQPANLFNDITTPRESNASTAFWNPALPASVTTFPKTSSYTTAFGPSIGFAYSPQWGGWLTGNGKTVFRGGYRIAYDPAFYNIYLNISTSAPFVFLQTFSGAAATGKGLPAVPIGPNVRASLAPFITRGVFDPRTFAQTTIPTTFQPDRVQSYSFGFEREITKNSAFEARYVGNHADNLFQSINANPFITDLAASFPQFTTGLTPCPTTQQIGPGAGSDVGRVNCGSGIVRSRTNTGYSDYNGLQLEFRAANLFKQLTVRTGYTWSKTTDNASEIFSTGTAGNTVAISQNPLDFSKAEHGTSGLDFPQRWTITFTEQFPFFREQHGVVGHLLGGWAVAAGYQLGSGQPYTPAQILEATLTDGGKNFYDSGFFGTFFGNEPTRPFAGNSNAPVTSVGIFAGDACSLAGVTLPSAASVACAASPGQLISVNALNAVLPNGLPNASVVNVTQNDVRFIVNTGRAQALFGTPFGNVARNTVRDAITNVVNMSVYKRFKMTEHTAFEIHATAINALNHFNFASVDPTLVDAGNFQNGNGFGDPSLTGAGGRRLIIGGKFTF